MLVDVYLDLDCDLPLGYVVIKAHLLFNKYNIILVWK